MADGLSKQYADLLTGSYDCVDRIVLNAYFRMGHDPGGFRVWWRALTGSDATLDNTHLMRLAGRFSRRIRGYAKANDIPVVDCAAGERKHDLAEEYLAKTKITQGLFRGHITIKISGYSPFPAQVMLNGHEYVACQARKAGIHFAKEGNCFTHISDAVGLAKIADTLSAAACCWT